MPPDTLDELENAEIEGHITDPPHFIDADERNYRLADDSPGMDAGLNLDWMEDAVDLDGNPRISSETGIVDIGAYERQ